MCHISLVLFRFMFASVKVKFRVTVRFEINSGIEIIAGS